MEFNTAEKLKDSMLERQPEINKTLIWKTTMWGIVESSSLV